MDQKILKAYKVEVQNCSATASTSGSCLASSLPSVVSSGVSHVSYDLRHSKFGLCLSYGCYGSTGMAYAMGHTNGYGPYSVIIGRFMSRPRLLLFCREGNQSVH
eukprot:scpid805/ scgid6894/ 